MKTTLTKAVAFPGLALLTLTGAAMACPKAIVAENTEKWVAMNDIGPQVEALISDPQIECSFQDDKAVATLRFKMSGKAQAAGKVELPYFVAVAYMNSAEPMMVSKEIVTRTVNFPAANQEMSAQEEMKEIEIPLKPMVVSRDYQVLVGFQLKPEQLEANRHSQGGLMGLLRSIF